MVKHFLNISNFQSLISAFKRKPTKPRTTCKFFQTTNSLTQNRRSNENEEKIRLHVPLYYFKFMRNYNKLVKKLQEGSLHIFRTYSDGIKSFLIDFKEYVRVVHKLKTSEQKFQNLTLKEIEVYDQMPEEMKRMIPILFISMLPIVCYVVLPVAYVFPKYLLCSHFWTQEQKVQFGESAMKKRLMYSSKLLSYLQNEVVSSKNHKSYDEMVNLLKLIEQGDRPDVRHVLLCKDFFKHGPCSLFSLSRKHVKYLLKTHGLHLKLRKITCLEHRALIIKEMDRAIVRGGGVQTLSPELIKSACFTRGLYPVGMENENMKRWLSNWLTISLATDKNALSFLLHCSLFLGYNEPSNLKLINKR